MLQWQEKRLESTDLRQVGHFPHTLLPPPKTPKTRNTCHEFVSHCICWILYLRISPGERTVGWRGRLDYRTRSIVNGCIISSDTRVYYIVVALWSKSLCSFDHIFALKYLTSLKPYICCLILFLDKTGRLRPEWKSVDKSRIILE